MLIQVVIIKEIKLPEKISKLSINQTKRQLATLQVEFLLKHFFNFKIDKKLITMVKNSLIDNLLKIMEKDTSLSSSTCINNANFLNVQNAGKPMEKTIWCTMSLTIQSFMIKKISPCAFQVMPPKNITLPANSLSLIDSGITLSSPPDTTIMLQAHPSCQSDFLIHSCIINESTFGSIKIPIYNNQHHDMILAATTPLCVIVCHPTNDIDLRSIKKISELYDCSVRLMGNFDKFAEKKANSINDELKTSFFYSPTYFYPAKSLKTCYIQTTNLRKITEKSHFPFQHSDTSYRPR